MRYPQQEYWSGLPIPSPRDLPVPGMKPASPALQADSLPLSPPGRPTKHLRLGKILVFTQRLLTTETFGSVQLLSRVQVFVTPRAAARQASLSITNFWSSLKLASIKSVMPSKHLILCPPRPLPASVFPSIRGFSSESVLRIRWPKHWRFSFSISPSDAYSGLISFRMDWLDLLAVQGTLKSLLQNQSSKTPIDEGLKCQHKVHSQGLLIPGPTGFSLYGALYKLS